MSAMNTPMGDDRDHIQSLERGLAVLLTFDAERPNPTLAEIAGATGLSRPAVRRILLTLQRLGYVESGNGRWALTPRVLSIGQHYTASHALTEIAQPHLVALAEQTEESATLAALDGTDVVYVARVPIRRVLSVNVSPGSRVPAHATSLGRVLLAWAPPQVTDRVIAESGLPSLTPHTITDPGRFREALRIARTQGFSLVADEREVGLISASAPVCDHTGTVIAAVASSTSSGRSTQETVRAKIVPLLLRAATRISADLGNSSGSSARSVTNAGHEGFF
jgi:IclR family pca regulon transcriptional regulator